MAKDGALSPTQRQRGMYVAAGSQDIGRDPSFRKRNPDDLSNTSNK
jgi:hypothetical protein